MSNNHIPTASIRLILEYKSFPMWLCDENGMLVSEEIVDDLKNDIWLISELNDIQEVYNNLFIDTQTEFYYAGFPNDKVKDQFCKRILSVSQYVKKKIGDKYPIRDSFEEWLQRQANTDRGTVLSS